MAIVPSVTVKREIAAGRLVRVKVPELSMPRQTYMIYRERGQQAEAARALINVVRSFNWETAAGARVKAFRKHA